MQYPPLCNNQRIDLIKKNPPLFVLNAHIFFLDSFLKRSLTIINLSNVSNFVSVKSIQFFSEKLFVKREKYLNLFNEDFRGLIKLACINFKDAIALSFLLFGNLV